MSAHVANDTWPDACGKTGREAGRRVSVLLLVGVLALGVGSVSAPAAPWTTSVTTINGEPEAEERVADAVSYRVTEETGHAEATAKPGPAPREHAVPAPARKQPMPAPADPTKPASDAKPAAMPARRAEPTTASKEQYCAAVQDAAAKAAAESERQALDEMSRKIEKEVATLELRIQEHKEWLGKREAFFGKARENIVRIYSRMKVESAASQLSVMDEETAAAIIFRLDPKFAGIVLAEMEPTRAARLSSIIAGAAEVTTVQAGPEDKGAQK